MARRARRAEGRARRGIGHRHGVSTDAPQGLTARWLCTLWQWPYRAWRDNATAWRCNARARRNVATVATAWLGNAWHHSERRGRRTAPLSHEPHEHRQALTRTAEARLGWPLTREGTAARCTAAASHHRATALQSMAKAKRRATLQWRGVLGDAKQCHGYAANGQQGHGRALYSYGLAKMALQRQGKAKRSSAAATQSTAVATHSFVIRSYGKVKYGTAAHNVSNTERSATE